MVSPMPEFPEHILIPVGPNGEWPVDEDDACEYRCWCGVRGCNKWTEVDPNDPS